MPAILVSITAWLIRIFIPYAFVGVGFVVAYFMGWFKSIFFWILIQFMTLLEMFVGWVSGGTSIFQNLSFDSMPSEFLLFALHLRIPEAISILLSAFAIRLVRKAILRF